MIKKFSDTQPEPQEQETDRYELKEGLLFVIDGIVIVPSAKYEQIGKVNGYDLITKARLKYRTTSKVLIEQMNNMIASDKNKDGLNLADHIKVKVEQHKAEKSGRMFLTFVDPA
jgi:hypothetical protein